MATVQKLTAICILTFLLFSCEKERIDESALSSCKPAKIYYYDAGAIDDSLIYHYENNRLAKIQIGDEFLAFVYKDGRIVRRNFMESGMVVAYDTIAYNSQGQISKISFYLGQPPQSELYYTQDFTYANGRLTAIEENLAFAGGQLLYQFDYSGNNISRLTIIDESFGSVDTTVFTYTYDTGKNFYGQQQQVLLMDGFYHGSIADFVPFALSANNVVSVKDDQNSTTNFSYTVADNKLSDVKVDGKLFTRYQYSCR